MIGKIPIFNDPLSTKEETAGVGDQLTLALYKTPQTEESLNHQKFVSFNKLVSHSSHAVILTRLPPTSADSQHSYSYREFHRVWISTRRLENILAKQCGRKVENILLPVSIINTPALVSIIDLVSCSCKIGYREKCDCNKVCFATQPCSPNNMNKDACSQLRKDIDE